MKKAETIKENFNQEQIDQIKLYQGRLIAQFRQTETWDLINNVLLALKKKMGDERRVKMKLQATRENCLYFTGIEDGVDLVFAEINKIESDAAEIRAKKQFEANYQEQGD